MTVQSRPLVNGEVTEVARARAPRPVVIPLAALLIGAALWPVGARYSVDGLLWLVNQMLAFLRAPAQIPTPPLWQVYVVLAPIPIICSRVEWSRSIFRAPRPSAVVVWVLIAGYDLLTTFFGVQAPAPDAWDVTAQIARSLALSGILSVVLTFGPEWLMREGWKALRR